MLIYPGTGKATADAVATTGWKDYTAVVSTGDNTGEGKADLMAVDAAGAVESVTKRRGPVQVFNFEVEGDHTYFVGASKVLVHNACRIWPNNMAVTLEEELATAERLGIRLAKPGFRELGQVHRHGRRKKIKWAVLQDGQIVIMPKMVGKDELSHPVLSGGAPVQAAGEAQIAGGGGQYFRLEIDAHSGHFFKPGDPFWAAGGGAEQLGNEMFEAAGVMFG